MTDAVAAEHPRLVALGRSEQTVDVYYAGVAADGPANRPQRMLELVGAVTEGLAPRTGIATVLSKPDTVVSMAEHHASITHPETATVVAGQAIHARHTGADTILSMSCGTAPLDNELVPRGLMAGQHVIPLLSNKFRRMSPLTCPPFDPSAYLLRLASARAELGTAHDAVVEWWSGLVDELDAVPTFWQQLAIVNRALYQALFPRGDYVMVPMELVARGVLLTWLDGEDKAWLPRLLFDRSGRQTLARALDGVRSFWETDHKRGTFLFWHNDSGRLRPMFPDGDDLVSETGVRVELHPDAIAAALHVEKLLPATSCAFIVLAFHCGLRNFGGLLQYDYLPQARRRLLAADLDLTEDDRAVLTGCPDSYYVNFEEKRALAGGLARIAAPYTDEDLDSVAAEPIGASMRGCLNWVASLYR